jgi:hypothetical protein
MTCPNCGRSIHEDEQRTLSHRRTWGSPGYDEPACVHCAPDSDDLDRARDAYDDRRVDAMRDEAI